MELDKIFNKDDLEFRKKLLIEMESIENAITTFTIQYYDWSHIVAIASNDFDKKKRELKRVETYLYQNIKLNLDQQKIKTNDKMLDSKVTCHSMYAKAYDSYLESKHNFETIKAKKDALEVRLKMLEMAFEINKSKMFLKKQIKGESNGF
jgi:hypothetical protein